MKNQTAHEVDYIEVAIQMGAVGKKSRDVYASIMQAVKTVSDSHGLIKLVNKPGDVIENPPGFPSGSYKVMKNATLLPLNDNRSAKKYGLDTPAPAKSGEFEKESNNT